MSAELARKADCGPGCGLISTVLAGFPFRLLADIQGITPLRLLDNDVHKHSVNFPNICAISLDVPPKRLYNGGMVKITLRLPDWLHKSLQELADNEERSLNGQIVHLLREAIAKQGNPLTQEGQRDNE